MKKVSIWKFTASVAFLCSLGACTNTTSAGDIESDDVATSSDSGSSSKPSTKSSSSAATSCAAIKDSLSTPTNFGITKDTDTSWTLTWDYSRNDARAETGFEVQSLDMDAKSPEWETEGTTNADVTIYRLKGAKKVDKYYRVVATDKCGNSKESNRIQLKADGSGKVDSDSSEVTSNIPTDVAINRIAPSVWELSWKYSDATDDPNRQFVIQTSKLKDFKWTSVKEKIAGNVRHYFIQGRDQIETYYRLAVVNSGDTSAFTEAVQLTPNIAYRDYMSLDVPVPSTKITLEYIDYLETDKDTTTDDKTFTGAIATYTITENFISKYIVESSYTDTVYYEARWFTSLENYNYYKGNCSGQKKSNKCDSCYWTETFPYQEPSISKRFDVFQDSTSDKKSNIYNYCVKQTGYKPADHAKLFDSDTSAAHQAEWKNIAAVEKSMALCLESHVRGMCGYYLQLRIVWKDNVKGKGKGETDWSEWTQPFNLSDISGADKICNTL